MRKVAFALLIAAAVVRVQAMPSFGWLSTLGLAGYSLYAFHGPIATALLIFGWAWWLIIIFAVLVGLGAYYLVEKPAMKLGAKLATTRTVTA